MNHPDVLIGAADGDDAGVFRLALDGKSVGVVQTVDFFTPIVDSPYDWGRIAAANALSDIYAMGAEPLTALQLVGWPRDTLSFEVLGDVLRGGADVMAAAGTTIIGGHSIDDREPKYGFAVTGLVAPDKVVSNAAAQPGDHLILTKPLGTGIVSTAIKASACPPEVERVAVETMAQLNRDASEAMVEAGVRAATDVTGFGLLGHLIEILEASGVSAGIEWESVPVLPQAWDLLDRGYFPGGSKRNLASVSDRLTGELDSRAIKMLSDAQTSGGLLMAVPEEAMDKVREGLERRDVAGTVIGRIEDGPVGAVRLI